MRKRENERERDGREEVGCRVVEAPAQINSPERRIIVFGFWPGGAERYEKLKGCQLV